MSLLVSLFALQLRTIDLQTLDLSKMSTGWGRPVVDRSIQDNPLSIAGHRFAHGIGTHAISQYHLKLNGATGFDAQCGVDDGSNQIGSVEFIVLLDGKVKWRSGTMHKGDAAKPIHIDLRGATTLSLYATDAGDGSGYDHADWVDAHITTSGPAPTPMTDLRPVRIETAHAALGLYVTDDGRLVQRFFGAKDSQENANQPAYPPSGDGWIFEPALSVVHADGNTSTDLRVVKYSTEGNLTTIELKDPAYPFHVDLFFQSFPENDVIEAWTVVHHEEKGNVTLEQFASSAPDFGTADHWLTQFRGDWADEVNMSEEKLSYGVKTIDSKIGVRAHQFLNPSFLLSKGGPAQEDSGEVVGGSLAWSGSFAFKFEVDPHKRLRVTAGMNPYASEYHLKPNEKFETPKMIWAWSNQGTGQLSRNLHRWARKNALRDGDKTRAVLLNNWEATYFDFDEKKIISLFDGAKALGMELFLLDDGWFGRKYPRDGDTQGLGDWMPDVKKLPHGLSALTDAAKARGLRFGIWLEPEMVNPKSELFEKHPDWAIQQPKRELELQRHQLILDLTRPEVREFVFNVADKTLTDNPDISYVKWDCNRYVTQPGSTYLGKDNQSHLWIDYTRALYDVFDRLAKKHPNVEIMMCSGGGGRVDYGSLKFAQEYWPSDQTDPLRRIFIQWGYSHFFPAIATSDHVTHSGNKSLKFAFDVAMSGRLGMDMDLDKLSAENREFAKNAIATYKEFRDIVYTGDLYRLESPYHGDRASLMYTKENRAVVFAYALHAVAASPLKLKGLDPAKSYHIREVDLLPGKTGIDVTLDGATLMNQGLPLGAYEQYGTSVFEVTAP